MIRFFFMFLFGCVFSFLSAQSKHEKSTRYYNRALEEYRSGNHAASLDLVNQAIQLEANAQMYYLAGLNYEAQNQYLRAVSCYEACLQFDKYYREAIFQKALIYLHHGDPEQSVRDFNRLIDDEGFNETRSVYFQVDELGAGQTEIMTLESMEARFHHYRGQAYQKLNNYEAALSDFNQSLSLYAHTDYFVSRGLLYTENNLTKSGLADFANAIRIDSSNMLAWYNMALLDENLKVPKDLLERDGNAPLMSLMASRAMERGNYHLALEYFDISISKNESALVYENRGRAHTKLGYYVSARKDFRKSMELESARFESLYLIGNTYFFERDFSSALVYYDQYLAVVPDDAMIWYNAAMASLELDEEDNACIYLERASKYGMGKADQWRSKYCE